MDKARATLAELTELAGPNNVGPARPPVPSGYAGPQDVARPTMAQLTESATQTTESISEYCHAANDLREAIAALQASIATFQVRA